MYERVVAQLSPASWLIIGLLAIIAGKLIAFSLLMIVGAAGTVVGMQRMWKAAQEAE